MFWYKVGLLGKLDRYYRKKKGKRKVLVELFQKGMKKHYVQILLLGKLSLGLAIPAVIAAGLCRDRMAALVPDRDHRGDFIYAFDGFVGLLCH